MNENQITPDLTAQPKLAPVFCIGWYYNSYKGKKEQCVNRNECQFHRNFIKSNFEYSKDSVISDFRYIKEFRTCIKFIDNPIICDFCESLAIPGETHCEKCACLRTV